MSTCQFTFHFPDAALYSARSLAKGNTSMDLYNSAMVVRLDNIKCGVSVHTERGKVPGQLTCCLRATKAANHGFVDGIS